MPADPLTDTARHGRSEIADFIRFQIISGQLQFGEKINETRYTTLYGVSRTPVREALLLLESLGLVVIKPRSGTYVTAFTETSLRQLFEVRLLLESGGVRLASKAKRAKLLPRLETLFSQMDSEKEEDDRLQNFHSADTLFHEALVGAAENPLLMSMYSPIGARAQAVRSRMDYDPQIALIAQTHHQAIIDAIRRDDIDGFIRILNEHLTWVLGSLMMISEIFETDQAAGLGS